MEDIEFHNMNKDFEDYIKDESRLYGYAENISFPKEEQHIKKVLSLAKENQFKITVQGARTGITGGAVPKGGHILNLSKMNKITGLKYNGDTENFYLKVQPGVILSQINKILKTLEFDTKGWSKESLAALTLLKRSKRHFFPPDPTETSASIGGMFSCNASGACSYFYGPTGKYINSAKVILPDGSSVLLERGKQKCKGYDFNITTDTGKKVIGRLPQFKMPLVKNVSGYYVKKNMDLLDLFIGSEGTLGVISEMELKLIPYPEHIWGIVSFFADEKNAIKFVNKLKDKNNLSKVRLNPVAIEFFNNNALELLRSRQKDNPAYSKIPRIKDSFHTAIYFEFHGKKRLEMLSAMQYAGKLMKECNTDWVAANEADLMRLKFLRHAVPETVNMIIDKRKQKNKDLTKLGTDMAVPDEYLSTVLKMYNRDLKSKKLDYVMFGHIGDNHIHVNILPNNMDEYKIGERLYERWADKVVNLGGTVSAEHGIGKIKKNFLKTMYKDDVLKMKDIKRLFDPHMMLNNGNLFE